MSIINRGTVHTLGLGSHRLQSDSTYGQCVLGGAVSDDALCAIPVVRNTVWPDVRRYADLRIPAEFSIRAIDYYRSLEALSLQMLPARLPTSDYYGLVVTSLGTA